MNENFVLGIETSGILCSVAWCREGEVLLSYDLEEPNIHAALLADLIDKGFSELQLQPHDIDLVAVASGPGSFTGLRIGMSYAKGFCFGLNKPIIGVSNFEVLATQRKSSALPVYTLIDARRGKIYVGMFEGEEIRTSSVLSREEFIKQLQPGCQIIIHDRFQLDNIHDLETVSAGVIRGRYGADIVCRAGNRKFLKQGADSLNHLQPMYLQAFAGVL